MECRIVKMRQDLAQRLYREKLVLQWLVLGSTRHRRGLRLTISSTNRILVINSTLETYAYIWFAIGFDTDVL